MIPDDTNNEIAVLKNQVFTLLVALIVVSGTLTVSLYRQVSLTGKDIARNERISAQMNTNEMVIRAVVGRLAAYGQKHPDFAPVLKRNGILLTPGGPSNAPAPKK